MLQRRLLPLVILLCLFGRSLAAEGDDAIAGDSPAFLDESPAAAEDDGSSGQADSDPEPEDDYPDYTDYADEAESAEQDTGAVAGESADGSAGEDTDESAAPGGSPSPPSPPAGLEEVIVISKQQEKSDRVVSRLLSADEIFRIPALRDDALGAISTFAAVATLQSSFNGPPTQGYYFRGGNLVDNHFEIDGLEAPYIYHLGGPFSFSVINGRLVDRLKFYASNPDINYPNVSGGVIEVALKQPILEGFNQEYDIGALSAGAMIEGGFGNGRDGFWLAFRRSYIDFFLNAANLGPDSDNNNDPNTADDAPSVIRFPEFYDIQGRWYRELDDGYTDLTIITSRDKLLIRFEGEPEDPQFGGDLGNRRSYVVAGWRYQREPSDYNLYRLQVNFRFPRDRFIIGTQGAEDPNPGASFRTEEIARVLNVDYDHSWQPTDKFGLRYGVDLTLENLDNEGYIFAAPSPDEGFPSDNITSLESRSIDESVLSNQQEAHLSLRYLPIPDLTLELGARTLHEQRSIETPFGRSADIYFGGVSPRFHATYALDDRTSLFYRWGDYVQTPTPEQLNLGNGSPENLGLIRSRSNLLGLNFVIDGRRLQHDLSFELWHRELHDLIFRQTAECAGPGCFSNSGSGLAYGFDIEWTFRGGRRHYFRLAYSWLVTERRNNPSLPVYPSSADQPHTFKLLYSGPLTGRHERLLWGFYLSVNSGQPYTPVVNRAVIQDSGDAFFDPLYAPINSSRYPTFVQMNLGISYTSASNKWETQFSLLSAHQAFYKNVNEISYDGEYSNFRDPDELGGDFVIPSFVVIFRP